MGLPAYTCPSSFPDCWWQPVELLGCTVERIPVESHRDTDPPRVTRLSGGRVFYQHAEAAVSVVQHLDSEELPTDTTACILAGTGTGGAGHSHALSLALERVFLASGASQRGVSAPRSCKILLLGVAELTLPWPVLLRSAGLEVSSAPVQGKRGRFAVQAPDYTGIVERGSEHVWLFSGPAVDPDTLEIRSYLALDYGRSLAHRLTRPANLLAFEITKILEDSGALVVEPLCASERRRHPGEAL
jgi:hypothetical protein